MKTDPRRERALSLWKQGMSLAEIGRQYGVQGRTVGRWLNRQTYERDLASSRAAKARRARGVCTSCGQPVHYDNSSGLCPDCAKRGKRVWTEETIIEAILLWAETHGGEPPASTDWLHKGPGHPTRTNVYRSTHARQQGNPFQTWNDAIRAAGFEPRKPGLRKGYVSREK